MFELYFHMEFSLVQILSVTVLVAYVHACKLKGLLDKEH